MDIEIRELIKDSYLLRLTPEVLSCNVSEIIYRMQEFLLKKPRSIVLAIDDCNVNGSIISGLIVLLHSVLNRNNIKMSIIEESGYYSSLCNALNIPAYSNKGVFMETPHEPEIKTALVDISSLHPLLAVT